MTLHSLWTTTISVNAAKGTRSTSLSHLGQASIVSPQVTLQHFLSSINREATWCNATAKLFEHEREDDGLGIGHYPSPSGISMFGIGRASETQMLKPSIAPFQVTGGDGHWCSNENTSFTLANGPLMITAQIRRHNLPWVLISTVSMALLSILTSITFLLVYIFLTNQSSQSGNTVQTTASLSYILAASQLTSTVMFLAVAPIMGVHAFRIASLWADDIQSFEAPLPSE